MINSKTDEKWITQMATHWDLKFETSYRQIRNIAVNNIAVDLISDSDSNEDDDIKSSRNSNSNMTKSPHKDVIIIE